MADSPSFVPGRIGIVGLGLIGGSFAKAYAAAGHEVYGWNRDEDTLRLAKIETISGELDDITLPTCELIILAGYPEFCVRWLQENAGLISPDAIVIDVAGIKRDICERCRAIARDMPWEFCGAHPMAGTQYSGFAYSRATMFKGAPIVLVPRQDQDPVERMEFLERLKGLLAPCGFKTWSVTTPEEHDRLIAYTSQLAHVVSNAYVKSPTAQRHHGFSAGSYRDLTRVAQLNADMWSELFLENADFLSEEVGTIIRSLQEYKDAIDAGDRDRLHDLLAEGSRLKREAESRGRS
ncbi:MAG: prephenate dehydrogenase [Atopobiaceae bacterium]|nr:prephenate dehydrogenase [Atopobiaceae bacterium]